MPETDAGYTAGRISIDTLIGHVLSMRHLTKIRPPVVTLITIDVINGIREPVEHDDEDDNVGEVSPTINVNSGVTSTVVIVNNNSTRVCLTIVTIYLLHSDQPTGLRVIFEESLYHFLSNHSAYSAM